MIFSLALDVLDSGNVCSMMSFILNDMLAVMGGGQRSAVILSFALFVVPMLVMFGIEKNMVFGMMAGFIGHSIWILLLSSCITLSTSMADYYSFAWIFEILIFGAVIVTFIGYQKMND